METEDESAKKKRNFLQAMLSFTQSQPNRLGTETLQPEDSDSSLEHDPQLPDSQEEDPVPRIEPLPGDLDSAEVSASIFRIPELIKLDGLKLQSAHKVTILGIDVMFPFQPYPAQVTYMTQVIETLNGSKNALLQSPTGTGKTLCLLCATMAWMNHYRDYYIKNPGERQSYRPVKLYYASRTHSQLQQVVKELKRTCYRPVSAILGSREQQCIKADFTGLQKFQMNAACKEARQTHLTEQRCVYFDTYSRNKKKYTEDRKKVLLDIEELREKGRKDRFCPYFIERDMSDNADIVLLPYNYLLDAKIRESMSLSLTDGIMVFDEAHNLERLAEDGCSFRISTKDMENCEGDIKLLRQKLKRGEESQISEEDLDILKVPIMALSKNLEQMKKSYSSKSFKRGGRFRYNKQTSREDKSKNTVSGGRQVFTFFKENTAGKMLDSIFLICKDPATRDDENPFREGLDMSNLPRFLDLIGKALEALANVPVSKGGLDMIGFAVMIMLNLAQLEQDARTGRRNISWSENYINSYMFHTDYEDDEDGEEFSFALSCLHPGIGFAFIQNQGPRSIILTSGTLAPLKSFETEFATNFAVKLENSHVINTKTQCSTVIVKAGPTGYPLNFCYDNRDDTATYKEMGEALLSLAKMIPNGMLICFASYSLMNKCLELWENEEKDGETLLKRIENLKPIYKEPRKSSQLNSVMEKYLKDAKTKGAILCCVCRGKVSEGIDFADEMARAVVLIGIPYPALGDMRVTYKKKFLTENQHQTRRINGTQWYMQQTVRAVNQAIGRVIRHINDYGMVFLCDNRYASNQFEGEFPRWIADNIQSIDKFGFITGRTATFFRSKSQSAPLSQLLNSQTQSQSQTQLQSQSHPQPQTQIQTQTPIQNTNSNIRGAMFTSPIERQANSLAFNNENSQTSPFESRVNFTNVSPIQEMPSKPVNQNNSPAILKQNDKSMARRFYPVNDDEEDLSFNPQRSNPQPSQMLEETSQNQILSRNGLNAQDYKSKKPKLNENKQKENRFELPAFSFHGFGFSGINDQNSNHMTMNSMPFQFEQRMDKSITRKRSFTSEPEDNGRDRRVPMLSGMLDIVEEEEKAQNVPNFGCPLCYTNRKITDILKSKCSHTACRHCWEITLREKHECPFCHNKVLEKQLIPLVEGPNFKPVNSAPQSRVPSEKKPNVRSGITPPKLLGRENDIQQQIMQIVIDEEPVRVEIQPNRDADNQANDTIDVQCVVCFNSTKNKNPVTSECGHTACAACWNNWLEWADQCPSCAKPIKRSNLKEASKPKQSPSETNKTSEEKLNSGQNSESKLGCMICFEVYNENMMTARCGHIACQDCWTQWLGKKQECPTCKKATKQRHLIKLHI